MKIQGCCSSVFALILLGTSAPVLAEEMAPGVQYQTYHLPGPTVAYAVSVDRQQSEYKLKVGWPQHKRNFTARETTSTISSRYHHPPAESVLAATNGSFFADVPVIIGTAASGGQIQQAPDGQYDTLLFGPSREPVIRSNIAHVAGTLTFADGTSIPLSDYNRPNPGIHKVTAYTPDWDTSTRSEFLNPSLAVEVILENVSYPMRGDKEVSGIVSAMKTGTASENNTIPAGGMVLTAWGSTLNTITTNTSVGDRLRMSFQTSVTEYNNADMAISGAGWLIHDGAAYSANWSQYDPNLVYSRHPRTALGWNDTHLFMVVVDGRSSQSIGMTFQELASFLINTLGALDAINLDGGGSSTMVVDGTLRNNPSDGSERAVANAVLLVQEDTATAWPFMDLFAAPGRSAGWDDKFTYNDVVALTPVAPDGDGTVLLVSDPAGGVETVRRGDYAAEDYGVEADVYCEYRPGDAVNGLERYALFARDSGTGALGLSSYGGGNCYAMTFDSDDGRVRAGKYVNGTLTDFLEPYPLYMPSTGWRRFAVDCRGATIRYRVDDRVIAVVEDATHGRGFFGIGYHELFDDDGLIHGTRCDNLVAVVHDLPAVPGDFDWDGDVDQKDFGHFQECLTGNNVTQDRPACQDARLDIDGDVDEDDFSLFQTCMTLPGEMGDPECAVGTGL